MELTGSVVNVPLVLLDLTVASISMIVPLLLVQMVEHALMKLVVTDVFAHLILQDRTAMSVSDVFTFIYFFFIIVVLIIHIALLVSQNA